VVCEVEDLGCARYEDVLARMHDLHARVRAGAGGRILFVEHEPVYTAGRATPAAELAPGILPVERGGQITYHGPGQLVVYPIVPLPRRDIRDWLSRLEAFGVAVCADLGLAAEASVDGTGVFVAGYKVASIGVAVRHWINLHGIAINVAMDLTAWQRVRPCGRAPDVMSDLSSVAGRPIAMAAARAAACGRVFLLTDPGHPV
jgi:lipoate-protein ligase B